MIWLLSRASLLGKLLSKCRQSTRSVILPFEFSIAMFLLKFTTLSISLNKMVKNNQGMALFKNTNGLKSVNTKPRLLLMFALTSLVCKSILLWASIWKFNSSLPKQEFLAMKVRFLKFPKLTYCLNYMVIAMENLKLMQKSIT